MYPEPKARKRLTKRIVERTAFRAVLLLILAVAGAIALALALEPRPTADVPLLHYRYPAKRPRPFWDFGVCAIPGFEGKTSPVFVRPEGLHWSGSDTSRRGLTGVFVAVEVDQPEGLIPDMLRRTGLWTDWSNGLPVGYEPTGDSVVVNGESWDVLRLVEAPEPGE